MKAIVDYLFPVGLCALLLAGCGGNEHPPAEAGKTLGQGTMAVRAGALVSPSVYEDVVQQMYIAYFGRPADPDGLAYYTKALADAGAPTTIDALLASEASTPITRALFAAFSSSAESRALYGEGASAAFVTDVYMNVLGRYPEAAGLQFWSKALDSNAVSRGNAALTILSSALATSDKNGVLAKMDAARLFTGSLRASSGRKAAYAGPLANSIGRDFLRKFFLPTSWTQEWVDDAVDRLVEYAQSNTQLPEAPPVGTSLRLASLHSNWREVFALDTTGGLWAWGLVTYVGGEINVKETKSPVFLGRFDQVATRQNHVLAIKADGSLWAWGVNTFGEVGKPLSARYHAYPAPLMIGSGFSAIATGQNTSYGIKSDGSLWGWGNNSQHALGLGKDLAISITAPRKIGDGYLAVAAASNYAAAIKTDGSLWGWGTHRCPIFGGKSVAETPVKLGEGYAKVFVTQYDVYGIKASGEMWAVGCADPSAGTAGVRSYGQGFKKVVSDIDGNEVNYLREDGSVVHEFKFGYTAPFRIADNAVDIAGGGSVLMLTRDGSLAGFGPAYSNRFAVDLADPLLNNVPYTTIGSFDAIRAGTVAPLTGYEGTKYMEFIKGLPKDPIGPGAPSIPGGPGIPGTPGALVYSDWFFVQSDKALQERWAIERMDGNVATVRIQYRVLKSDPVHCTAPTCNGYYLFYSFRPANASVNQQRFYWFTRDFNGPWDAPAMTLDFRLFPDGSQLKWSKELGIRMYQNGKPTSLPWDDRCVDNRTGTSTQTRCTGVNFANAIAVSSP